MYTIHDKKVFAKELNRMKNVLKCKKKKKFVWKWKFSIKIHKN